MKRKVREEGPEGWFSGSVRRGVANFQRVLGKEQMPVLVSFLFILFFLHPAHAETCAPRAAAMTGKPEAENLLGLAYIDGKKGCVQNSERGIRWLKKAAAAGSQNAVDNLCWAYGGGYMPDKNGNRVANPLLPVHPAKESYWCGKSDIPE